MQIIPVGVMRVANKKEKCNKIDILFASFFYTSSEKESKLSFSHKSSESRIMQNGNYVLCGYKERCVTGGMI